MMAEFFKCRVELVHGDSEQLMQESKDQCFGFRV